MFEMSTHNTLKFEHVHMLYNLSLQTESGSNITTLYPYNVFYNNTLQALKTKNLLIYHWRGIFNICCLDSALQLKI